MTKWIMIGLLICFVAAVWAATVFMVVIKPEKNSSRKKPTDYGLTYERLTFFTDDGIRLAGWLIPQPKTNAVIIIGHGYPFDKSAMLKSTHFLNQQFNLIYFDFRYFGESDGNYTTFGVKEKLDIKAVLDFIKKRADLDVGKIGMLGYSLSATSFIQAQPKQVQALVLDSPFISMKEMAKGAYRWLVGPFKWPMIALTELYCHWFIGLDLDKASALNGIDQLSMPILFLHGDQDKQIPMWHSKKLYQLCLSKQKEYVILKQAGHSINDQYRQKLYNEKVLGFFNKQLLDNAERE